MGLLNIRPQSPRSVLAAGPNCELCMRMVMLCFSPACANLREGRGEGNGKALNGEKFAVNGFCCGLSCENCGERTRRGAVKRRETYFVVSGGMRRYQTVPAWSEKQT